MSANLFNSTPLERPDEATPTPQADVKQIDHPPPKASLEQRNEEEILQHPKEVTQNAQIGVQKAEATALVWSKTAVRAIYAW